MALLHADALSAYGEAEDLDRLYTRAGDSAQLTFDRTGGPGGTGALAIGGAAAFSFFRTISAATDITMGVAFTYQGFDTDLGSGDEILLINTTTTTQISLVLRSDGSLRLYRGASVTLLFDSTNLAQTADGQAHLLSPGQEVRLELRVVLSDTVGILQLWIDDTLWCSRSNIDTSNSGTTANRIYWKTNGSGAQYAISWWYALDNTGSFNNSRLVGWKFTIARPDADVASDFTPTSGTDNFAMVDEEGAHDWDNTTNSTSTNGHIDRFTHSATLPQDKVHGINVVTVPRHGGAAQNFRNKLRHSASDTNGTTTALTEAHRPLHMLVTTNPSTTAQFTKAEAEAVEFGYEQVA